jgi:hypothetical protein
VETTGRKSPLLTKKSCKKETRSTHWLRQGRQLQAMDYGLFEEVGWPRTERSEVRCSTFSVFCPSDQLHSCLFWLVETSSKLNNIYFAFPAVAFLILALSGLGIWGPIPRTTWTKRVKTPLVRKFLFYTHHISHTPYRCTYASHTSHAYISVTYISEASTLSPALPMPPVALTALSGRYPEDIHPGI